MAEKPAPKADDTYTEEETVQRRDATIRAMIGMKPRPREAKKPKKESSQSGKRKQAQ